MNLECKECGSKKIRLKVGPADYFNPLKLKPEEIEEIEEMNLKHYVTSWHCKDCLEKWPNVTLDGEDIEPDDFVKQMKISLSNSSKIKNFSTFTNTNMDPNDQKYLDKLRRLHPTRDIPSDTIISQAISKLKNGKEKVIDDLIIRKEDGQIEFELI